MDVNQFRAEGLKAHNEFRKMHGAEPLKLDEELNNFAQNWAETMAKSGFRHSYNSQGYGENIAYKMQSETPTGREITKMWYDEVKDYDFETHKSKRPGAAVGHFTQVVWKETRSLGLGIAKVDRKFYAVGSYKVAGNMMSPGYYEKNVGRKLWEEEQLPGSRDVPDAEIVKSDDATVESDDDVKESGNKLARPQMKAFRREFTERLNEFRGGEGIKTLEDNKSNQKLAQKSANWIIKGKERDDKVKAKIQMQLRPLPTGGKAMEDLKQRAETDSNSKNIFDSLMSPDFNNMGVGVSCTAEDGGEAAFLFVYLD